jgi:choline dehydrogenase
MAWGDSCVGAFQKWADDVGDQTFTFDIVSNYYRKAMNFTPPDLETRIANATPSFNPALVVQGGPLDVTYPAYAYSWTSWLAIALESVGVLNTDSFINGALNGSAWHMNTVNHTTGTRASAATAYLRPFLQRPNLAVFNGTLGERIIFDDNKTATGVLVTRGDTSFNLTANREVILSGGVFQSPQLLQVSGVGPAALLQEHGIPVVADRPGVGQNLNDQIFFGIAYRVKVPTLSTIAIGDQVAIDIELFNNNATGRLTNPGGEYGGFEKLPTDLRSNFSTETQESKQPSA